jgi:hypothetical protein
MCDRVQALPNPARRSRCCPQPSWKSANCPESVRPSPGLMAPSSSLLDSRRKTDQRRARAGAMHSARRHSPVRQQRTPGHEGALPITPAARGPQYFREAAEVMKATGGGPLDGASCRLPDHAGFSHATLVGGAPRRARIRHNHRLSKKASSGSSGRPKCREAPKNGVFQHAKRPVGPSAPSISAVIREKAASPRSTSRSGRLISTSS